MRAFLLLETVLAATRTLEWNITYVDNVKPDNQVARRVIGVNNQWPIPKLEFDHGDNVLLTVNNHLPDQPTSLHAHGFFQNGTNYADGVPGATQCQIPVGGSMLYNYTLQQNGTYWIHSHTVGQWPDGLRTPFVIHAPKERYEYDEEVTVYLSDWYHDPMEQLKAKFADYRNPTGAEPVPNSALINDSQNVTFSMTPGKVYRFRLINVSGFAAFHFWMEGHTMEVIEVDGVDTEPKVADGIVLTSAQRYSVLVRAREDSSTNFAMVASMDEDMFDVVPAGLNNNVTAYLVYDSSAPLPAPALVDTYPMLDDFELEPADALPAFEMTQRIDQNVVFDNLDDGVNYAFFNGLSYQAPKTPTLYTVLAAGNLASNVTIYGSNTGAHVTDHLEVVEMVINNRDPGKHPFHMHGHVFQLVKRSAENEGDYDPTNTTWTVPTNPMRRDTVQVPPQGHAVIRYVADNPGVWLFHCHLEWHVISGLTSTIVEAPLLLQSQHVPQAQFDMCSAQKVETRGNAAGNVNLLDLTGENVQRGPIPDGITARGIVALFFNALCAVIGMAAIAWYGLGEMRHPATVVAAAGEKAL